MIAYQNSESHKEFIAKMEELVEKIHILVSDSVYLDAAKFKEKTELPKLLKEVDKLLTERFKVRFRHNIVDDGTYGILAASTADTRDVIKKSRQHFKSLREVLKSNNIKDSETKRLYNQMYDNIAKITSLFRNKGAGVNLKTAEFINMDDPDIVIDMIFNPVVVIKKMGATPRAILSIIFHEISHLLTYIEYADLVYGTSIKINEVVKHTSGDEYQDIKIMKTILNDEDIKESNIGRLYVYGQVKDLPKRLFPEDYTYKREAERVADAGAIRLYQNIEFSRALIIYRPSLSILLYEILKPTLFYFIIAALIQALGTNIMFFWYFAGLSLALGLLTFMAIVYAINLDKGNKDPVYDSVVYRVKRMKTSLIEVIRTQNLTREDKKIILSQIDELDEMVHELLKKEPLLRTFIDNLPWHKSATDYYEFEDALVDLMENDLHASALKLKLHLGGR